MLDSLFLLMNVVGMIYLILWSIKQNDQDK